MSTTPAPATDVATPRARVARVARDRLWPLWGAVAGLAGFLATIFFDTRPEAEMLAADAGEPFTSTPDAMDGLFRETNYLGFVFGFVAVVGLVVLAAAWRSRVESRWTRSIAARVVSGGLLVAAAGLTLAYGWKGALANYGYDGPEAGLFGDEGLFVYYVLTDFGPYIPWFGVLIMAGALGWMAWVERSVSRVLGTLSGLYALAIFAGYIVSGVPGIAGPGSGLWLLVASIWLAVGRSEVTTRVPE